MTEITKPTYNELVAEVERLQKALAEKDDYIEPCTESAKRIITYWKRPTLRQKLKAAIGTGRGVAITQKEAKEFIELREKKCKRGTIDIRAEHS